jgi:hypothetical protein
MSMLDRRVKEREEVFLHRADLLELNEPGAKAVAFGPDSTHACSEKGLAQSRSSNPMDPCRSTP